MRRDGFVVIRAADDQSGATGALLERARCRVLSQLEASCKSPAYHLDRIVHVVNKPSHRHEVLLDDNDATSEVMRLVLRSNAEFYAQTAS